MGIALSPPNCTSTSAKPCIDASQAQTIAKAFLRTRKIDASRYKARQPDYYCAKTSCTWLVAYSHVGELVAIGDHFAILVNASTCAATLEKGL